MSHPPLKLDAEAVNALLRRAFPQAQPENLPLVARAAPGEVYLVRPFDPGMLRPGGVISGPTLMSLADTAAYALVLCHTGETLMAVTSSLTMHFLRGAAPGDIHIQASLLRLGRRNAVCDVRIWTETPERIAAHATVTYALPTP